MNRSAKKSFKVQSMRPIHRVLLVVLLAAGIVAAAVCGEKLYLAPLVVQSNRADATDGRVDELPAVCLEELATMGPSAIVSERSSAEDRPDSGSGNVLRPMPDGNSSRATSVSQREISVEASLAVNRPTALDAASEPRRSPPGSDSMALPIPSASPSDSIGSTTKVSVHERQDAPVTAVRFPVVVDELTTSETFADSLRSSDVMELMRQLRSEDGGKRTVSRTELRRRGYSEVDLELARQLYSPDAETRKQLARTVPRLESVDASRWLMWLALDPEPEVRRAAITTLATTGDPGLLERVEAMVAKDTDPQIQALAGQIAKQREMAAGRGEK